MNMNSVLLPDLDISCACQVNLNSAAEEWLERGQYGARNPLLSPAETQAMVDRLHNLHQVEWSYGGYLEDRATLLRGSYLDKTGGYIHLGVDVNVPAGTRVSAPFDGVVVNVFNDGDEPQGWGLRLILRPDDTDLPYLALGHLAESSLFVGDRVCRDHVIARVAPPPYNGNWFPHLHIQHIAHDAVAALQEDDFYNFDGYGHPKDIDLLRARYPDPSWLVTGQKQG